MTLFEKIKALHPEFTDDDHINLYVIQDDMDGRGAYIASWNHPTAPRPTDTQIQALGA